MLIREVKEVAPKVKPRREVALPLSKRMRNLIESLDDLRKDDSRDELKLFFKLP